MQKRATWKRAFFFFIWVSLSFYFDISSGFCDEPFVFAVVGDTRPERDLKIPKTFLTIIDHFNIIEPQVIFHVGDIIYGKTSKPDRMEKEYQDFFHVVSKLRPPLYIIPGNHDIWNEHSAYFFAKTFGYLYRSFRFGKNYFLLLNSEIPGQKQRIAGRQLEWLKNELRQASEKEDHIFIFIHRPLFPVNGQKGQSMDRFPEERDDLHKLFQKYQVLAVISGHEHIYHYMEKDGIKYITSGGGGKRLYAREKEGGIHHFLLFKVQDREVTFSIFRIRKK